MFRLNMVQLCNKGDIVGKQNGQCACVQRTNVLGLNNGYILCCYDGPNDTYPNHCAMFGEHFEQNWSMMSPNITGTIDITTGTTQINGTGTTFTSQLVGGDKLILGEKQACIDTVVNDTTVTLTEAYTGVTLSGSNLWKL